MTIECAIKRGIVGGCEKRQKVYDGGGVVAELLCCYVPYNPKLVGTPLPDRWFWFWSWCSLAAAAE